MEMLIWSTLVGIGGGGGSVVGVEFEVVVVVVGAVVVVEVVVDVVVGGDVVAPWAVFPLFPPSLPTTIATIA